MKKDTNTRYSQLCFLLKYSSGSFEFNGLQFLRRIGFDKVYKFVNFKKVKDRYTGSVDCYFSFNIKDNSSNKVKKIPVIVQKCNVGYKDVISGEVYNVEELYNTSFPAISAYDDLSPSEVAKIIRSLSPDEIVDYINKSKEFKDFLIRYHDILESIGNIKDSAESERKYVDTLENMFITNFQRERDKFNKSSEDTVSFEKK